jgi:uncharacterized protein YjbJ (UPF0337 family)
MVMMSEQLDGKFEQFRGIVKKNWGVLIHDDFVIYNGLQEVSHGKAKVEYSLAREEAKRRRESVKALATLLHKRLDIPQRITLPAQAAYEEHIRSNRRHALLRSVIYGFYRSKLPSLYKRKVVKGFSNLAS